MNSRPATLWGCLLALGAAITRLDATPLEIREHGFTPERHFFVRLVTAPNYYYVLRRGALVARLVNPRDLALPAGAELVLRDDAPNPEGAFYRVQAIHVSAPEDVDGDGIDDLYELLNAAFLDPLNPLDALLDPDGDGVNNLTAYRRLFGYADTPPTVVGREVSLFNFDEPVHRIEAVSAELSVYNGAVISPSDAGLVVSREASAFNFGSPPLGSVWAVSRETSVFNFGSPPHRIEALSREVAVYRGAVISAADPGLAVSREASVFNFGQQVRALEAISRETSVLNFQEPN
jgi:hypothetical protein